MAAFARFIGFPRRGKDELRRILEAPVIPANAGNQ